MARSWLTCPACGGEIGLDTRSFACGCGLPLEVRHEFDPIKREQFDADGDHGACSPTFASGRASGVWRYRELVAPTLPADEIISLGEGNTPLFWSPAVSSFVGVDHLGLKHEGMNPTGSFKDRGMTVAVSQARRVGAKSVVCASTGNTSASLAAFAAAAGLTGVILVPEAGTARGKLSQAIAYGARTLIVRGDFDAAMGLVRELSESGEPYLCNSLNPFRVEGQKTIVIELLHQLDWRAPDWIVMPAGNLGNTAAFGKALVELRDAGLIDRVPRLAPVQAAGAAPFHAAFERDFDGLEPLKAETIASAIRIGDPVSYERAVRSLRATNGVVAAVTDAEILDAKAVVDAAGIGAEPASCASVAGARQLVARGVIDGNQRVVCVLTGHLLKDAETTLSYHEGRLGEAPRANVPVTVNATLEDLRAALQVDA